MLTYFYDIESTQNVFTMAVFKSQENALDLYVLADNQEQLLGQPNFDFNTVAYISKRVLKENKNFNGVIRVIDLHDKRANIMFARLFGMSDAAQVNNPNHVGLIDQGLYLKGEGLPCPYFDPDIEEIRVAVGASTYRDIFRPVCDTDPEYIKDPDAYPYLLGYNSQNYDTTVLAAYLDLAFPVIIWENADGKVGKGLYFKCPTAKAIHDLNQDMFAYFNKNMPDILLHPRSTPAYALTSEPRDYNLTAWKYRKNMLMTGRYIDVARLNEKQQHTGLKRVIGMLGGQILESSKIKPGQDVIENLDQLADLLAYNASDVINLDYVVFRHKTYQSQFALKKGLLATYPELIYQKKNDAYAPDISPYRVRNDRLFIDSSSAQLATKALCPYGHLKDIETVSFLYPSEAKAKELGVPRVNVLDEVDKLFRSLFPQPDVQARWDAIFRYYKTIEGKNFNASKNYASDFPGRAKEKVFTPAELTKPNTCIPYFDDKGQPTSCFAAFSIGGIHGAEYNKARFEHDWAKWRTEQDLMDACQAIYPNPVDLRNAGKVEINGVTYSFGRFLKSGSTTKKASYKLLREPELFVGDPEEGFKLNAGKNGYAYTSADPTNHEDFTSYYPNLLRMMSAFWNKGLGYDRYAEIFDNKQNYGFLMKPKNANLTPELADKYRHLREGTGLTLDPLVISDDERAMYANLREGTKLILNSASGAADANFESNIRMNNQIISMRVIGQLFSFRIAMVQTYKGAKITSTNTDGLYSVMEETLNAAILAKESADIGVEIEPEPTYLISKDTNNRIELDAATRKITSASGGTVGCRKGPNPTKALSHPAIIDWALAEYLVAVAMGDHGLSLADKFSNKLGREILERSHMEFPDKRVWLQMFQNIIASSPGTQAFVFATKDGWDGNVILQHYNRVFIMKDGTPDTCHLFKAVVKKLTPQTIKKRAVDGLRPQKHDERARAVLTANGVNVAKIPQTHEAAISKYTNIEDTWCMYIYNGALDTMEPQKVDFLVNNMDMEKYLGLLRDSYMSSWRNVIPGHVDVTYEDDPPEPEPEPEPDAANGQSAPPAGDNAPSTAPEPDSASAPDAVKPGPPEEELPPYEQWFAEPGVRQFQGTCLYAQSLVNRLLDELDALDLPNQADALLPDGAGGRLNYESVLTAIKDAALALDPGRVTDACEQSENPEPDESDKT